MKPDLQSEETELIRAKNRFSGSNWIWIGLGWGYMMMIVVPLVNCGLWGDAPDLRPLSIVVQVVAWSGVGLLFGWLLRWSTERRLAKRVVKKK